MIKDLVNAAPLFGLDRSSVLGEVLIMFKGTERKFCCLMIAECKWWLPLRIFSPEREESRTQLQQARSSQAVSLQQVWRLATGVLWSEMHQQSCLSGAIFSSCGRSERAPKYPMPVRGLMNILEEKTLLFCWPFYIHIKFPVILASFCQSLFLHSILHFKFTPFLSPTVSLSSSFLFLILHMKALCKRLDVSD